MPGRAGCKENGRPLRGRPLVGPKTVLADQFIALATLLSTLLTLPPTLVMAAMAATEISEAISTYSMAVAPSSRQIKVVMATHDLGEAKRLAGDVVLLHRGRLVEAGAARTAGKKTT